MLRPVDELDELMHRSLKDITADRFELSVYFGRNLAERHARLSLALFNLFPVPLLRASFQRRRDQWRLTGLKPIPLGEIPASHRDFLRDAIEQHFARRMPSRVPKAARYRAGHPGGRRQRPRRRPTRPQFADSSRRPAPRDSMSR